MQQFLADVIGKARTTSVKDWFADSFTQRLFQNVWALLRGDAVARLLGLLSLALTARALGAEGFGVLVLVETYAVIVDRLINFQSWQALIKYGAEAVEQERREEFQGYVKLGTALDAGSALIGTVLAAAAAGWIGGILGWEPQTIQLARLYSLVILFNVAGTPIGVLRLLDRFSWIAVQRVVTAVVKLALVFAAYLHGAQLWTYAVIWMGTDALGYVMLLVMAQVLLHRNRFGGWWRSPIQNLRPFVSFTCWTNLSLTIGIPVKHLDVFIVSIVVSVEAVGIYKVFKQVAHIINKPADWFFQAVYPQFATLIANGEPLRAVKLAAKVGAFFLLVGTAVAIGLSLSSQWWLRVFFGGEFAAAWVIFTVYILLTALSLSFVCVHPLFTAMGYVQRTFVISLFANTGYLLIAWYLGSRFGLLGVVAAFGAQFITVVGCKLYFIRQGLRKAHGSHQVHGEPSAP